jgi:hypothetical protein
MWKGISTGYSYLSLEREEYIMGFYDEDVYQPLIGGDASETNASIFKKFLEEKGISSEGFEFDAWGRVKFKGTAIYEKSFLKKAMTLDGKEAIEKFMDDTIALYKLKEEFDLKEEEMIKNCKEAVKKFILSSKYEILRLDDGGFNWLERYQHCYLSCKIAESSRDRHTSTIWKSEEGKLFYTVEVKKDWGRMTMAIPQVRIIIAKNIKEARNSRLVMECSIDRIKELRYIWDRESQDVKKLFDKVKEVEDILLK